MVRRRPRSTRTAPPFPYTPLFLSARPAGAGHDCRAGLGRDRGSDRRQPCRRAGDGGQDLAAGARPRRPRPCRRSEEPTSVLQSLMRISVAVFSLKKKTLSIAGANSTDHIIQRAFSVDTVSTL